MQAGRNLLACIGMESLYEFINGFTAEGFFCLYDGLGPVAVVEAVGVELSLQRHAGALGVVNAALTVFIQIIAGIELNAGAVGMDFHSATGKGIMKDGTGVAVDFPVVVITALQMQRFIISTNVLPDGLGAAEIHRGAFDTAQFAGGDILGIVGIEEPAGNGEDLIHGSIYLFVACQVEVAVVGEIEDGILIADGFIDDVQTLVIIQGIGDTDGGVAGEALIAVGAEQLQGHGSVSDFYGLPHPLEEKVGTGMEVVVSFVFGHLVNSAVQDKAGTLRTVGIAAHGGTQSSTVGGAVALQSS